MLMLGERARAECKKREKKNKNEEEAEQRRGARTSKKSEGGAQNCKKNVRAACGARTSEKSEGGKYFIMHC
jgi:hypothetical protein